MAIEVPCPKCHAVLRAPDNMPGKRVRCKKCGESFRLPGTSDQESSTESQMLSVLSTPTATVTPAAAPQGVSVVTVAAAAPTPTAPPASTPAAAGSFDFDDGSDSVVSAPSSASGSGQTGKHRKKGESTGNRKLILLLGGLMFVMFLGLVGAGITVFMLMNKPTEQAAATAATAKSDDTENPRTPSSQTSTIPPTKPQETTPPTKPTPKTPTPSTPPKTPAKPATPAPTPTAPTFLLPVKPKGDLKVFAPARAPIALDFPYEAVRRIRFTESKPPMMAVLWSSSPGFMGQGAQHTVTIYNAMGGPELHHVEFPADGFTPDADRPFDFSPDGKHLAIQATSAGTLSVYDIDTGTKVLDAVEAFAADSGQPRTKLAALRFVTPSRLLAVDDHGGVDLWDLNAKKVIDSKPPIAKEVSKSRPDAAISKVRKNTLLLLAGGQLAVLTHTNTLSVSKPIPVSDAVANMHDVALSPDGKKAAVLLGEPGHEKLIRLAMGATPKIEQTILCPPNFGSPREVQFTAGSDAIEVTTNGRRNAVIYDLEENVVAAYLTPEAANPDTQQYPCEEQARHVWIAPNATDPAKSLLLGVEFPFDGYDSLRPAAKKAKAPVYIELRVSGLAK